MHSAKLRIIGILTLFTMAAMGVQGAAMAQSPRIDWAAPEEGMLVNTLPEFATGSQRRVVFTDRWQHEEYALFQAGGAQSEMIMSLANERDIIALEYALTVRRNIDTWNINRNHSIQYGRSGRVDGRLGTYFYEHYALSGVNRNCVGYYTTWDEHVEDYQGRPSKAVFGYYCAAPGDKITTAKVNDIVDSVDFRAAYNYARFEPTPPKIAVAGVAGQSAVTFAKGSNANAGNANFPFDMAVLIDEVEGEDRLN